MIDEIMRDIGEGITANMTNNQLDRFVTDYICNGCGTDFDKPGSCEECMDDEYMKIHRSYVSSLAIKRRDYMKNNSLQQLTKS